MGTASGKRRWSLRALPILLALLLSFPSCAWLCREQRREAELQRYGILESAVTTASDTVIGEFGESIPAGFDGAALLALVRGRIPKEYVRSLEAHDLTLRSRESYYLLFVRNPGDNAVILFDYSCSPEVDGPVLLDPVKYDPSRADSVDPCRGGEWGGAPAGEKGTAP